MCIGILQHAQFVAIFLKLSQPSILCHWQRNKLCCAALTEQKVIVQYIYALFISTSHLFCLGYGLASIPGTFTELCFTLVSMVIGAVLFLVVVGTLPTAVLEQEVSAAAHEIEGDHVPLPCARHVPSLPCMPKQTTLI